MWVVFVDLNKVYVGDCFDGIKKLDDCSVDMVFTSPPYWTLRDYDVRGQFGLESTFEDYVNKLLVLFDEIKRVLKDGGTCWVNMGDVYFGGGTGQDKSMSCGKYVKDNFKGMANAINSRDRSFNYSSKCLCMIPERFAIGMIDRGWILRNQIIWWKPNAMPHSVKDRFTVDFEKLFFFVKNKKYFFCAQREPVKEDSIRRACRGKNKMYQSSCGNWLQDYSGYDDMISRYKEGCLRGVHKDGRNKRTVWRINLKPGKYGHCAVFPEELVKVSVLAGCPEGGVVLDPFIGVGTVGVVCLKNNRNFVGFEINDKYASIAMDRVGFLSSQKKLGVFVGENRKV